MALTYLRARYYAPGTATFGVADAYLGELERPSTQNRYAYGLGNPLKHIDPTGHFNLWGAITGFFSNIGDSLSRIDFSDAGHAVLDVVGMVPGVGVVADVANGVWYAAEGNYVDAGMSFLSAIPGVGDTVGLAKMGVKAGKGLASMDATAGKIGKGSGKAGGASKVPGTPPPSLSPPGAGRHGAFRQAKRDNGIPTSIAPSKTDKKEQIEYKGRTERIYTYEFEENIYGEKRGDEILRDDARGHHYPDDPRQDRGSHFNDSQGNHYDY